MELIRVTNKQPRLLHLPDKVKTSGDAANARTVGIGTGKSLIPGGNNIERGEWERCARNPAVASWIKLGWLEIGGDTSHPEGPLAPLNLNDVGEQTAISMIEGEDSREVLGRWASFESRTAVKAAIQRKIEAVGGGGDAPARANTKSKG